MLDLALLNYRRDKDGRLSSEDQLVWDLGWLAIHKAALERHLKCPNEHSDRCIPLLRKAITEREAVLSGGPHAD